MQLKGKGRSIKGREGELKNFAKINKFMRKSKKSKKNQKKCAVNKKIVRGTSITIYYTYMSPVYAFM